MILIFKLSIFKGYLKFQMKKINDLKNVFMISKSRVREKARLFLPGLQFRLLGQSPGKEFKIPGFELSSRWRPKTPFSKLRVKNFRVESPVESSHYLDFDFESFLTLAVRLKRTFSIRKLVLILTFSDHKCLSF